MSKTHNKLVAALVVGVCVCLSGCFSIQSSRLACSGEQNLLVSNYGWYLFNLIPLACGNANKDHILPWVLLRNDVTIDKIQARFMDRARMLGTETPCEDELLDLTYHTRSSVLFNVPFLNVPVPIPYLLTYNEIQLSGIIRDKVSAEGCAKCSKEVKK